MCRFGKSTHIFMISNSVTHLRSYTNSAIADVAGNSAPISPVTSRDRRRLRIEHQYRRIEWPPRDRRRRCPKCRHLHIELRCLRIERRYRLIVWWVFHDVSKCFTSGYNVFKIYHNVLHVFHDVLLCLTIFRESRNDRRPPVTSGITTMPQRSAITP